MKTKQECKTHVDTVDVAMLDVVVESTARANQANHATKSPSRAFKLQPTGADKATKFKDEQHLQIETKDLGQDTAAPNAPPSNTNKKRRRRSAAEIDRKYKCPFAGCLKAYGSEGSLIHHQKLKHPERVSMKENDNQVGTFLLPLHNAPRNVMIRPATPLVALATDRKHLLSNQSTNDRNPLVPALDIVPLSAKAPRRSMRSRSNSEPVAFVDETNPNVCISTAALMTKVRPKTSRKFRRAVTPHAKTAAAATTQTKLRSKSESLPEMNLFQPFNELKIPSNYRSDSSVSAHETVLPISSTGSVEHGSFEWPVALISAFAGHHSTSVSSDEQAMDSDILSVLANCDAEDTSDSSVFNLGGGPPSTSSYQCSMSYGEIENTDIFPVGMECFKIAENATLPTHASEGLVMNEPEAELGLKAFATLGEDWTNDLLLSDHLMKMSMIQGDTPPHSLMSALSNVMPSEQTVHSLGSTSGSVHAAAPTLLKSSHFPSVSLDTFPVKTASQLRGDNELVGLNNTSFQQRSGISCTSEAAKMEDSGIQQMFWLSGEAEVATVSNTQPSSAALDQLLQHDDTLEWKPTDVFDNDEEANYALVDAGTKPMLL